MGAVWPASVNNKACRADVAELVTDAALAGGAEDCTSAALVGSAEDRTELMRCVSVLVLVVRSAVIFLEMFCEWIGVEH